MISPPASAPTPDELADWVELEVLFGDLQALAMGDALRLFAEHYGDDSPEEGMLQDALLEEESGADEEAPVYVDELREAAAEGLTGSEERWAALLATLNFRSQVVGAAYPLRIESDAVVLDRPWDTDPVYAFLALVAARLTYELADELAVHKPAKLFEQLVAIALGRYIGGTGYRFGWPRVDSDPVEDFPKKVVRLARRLGEELGAMRNVGPHDKDHQLDVIAWRSLEDATPELPTPGQAVIVCQCGIGADWHAKVLVAGLWKAIIDFAVTPISALAFPVVPSRDDEHLHIWHDIAAAGSIPFDRLRISSLLSSDAVPEDLKSSLVAWIEDSRGAIPIK